MDKVEFTNTVSGRHGRRSHRCVEYYCVSNYGYPTPNNKRLTMKLDGWVFSITDEKNSWEFLDGRIVINWKTKGKISYELGEHIPFKRFFEEVPVDLITRDNKGPRLI